MKLFKNSVDNFYKWVHGSEFVELDDIDVSEDPVRPELDLEWRKANGRKIYGLTYKNNIEGIICIAYCNDVPESVRELDLISQNAHLLENSNIAVAYTVWSRKRGAGKEIMSRLLEFLKNKPEITKLVTLSPLTPMATHFHIKNGAKLIRHNHTTQNFEYKLKGTK
mgnify:FL=1|jgi:hypothetical protein|tara:strand:- start:1 stop:498 length:498 start_codon:yes stop_codon:yes gene_type:complete